MNIAFDPKSKVSLLFSRCLISTSLFLTRKQQIRYRIAAFQQDSALPVDLPSITLCMRKRSWRAVLALSWSYLSSRGQGPTESRRAGAAVAPLDTISPAAPYLCDGQVWLCRITAFMKLRLFKEAADEMSTYDISSTLSYFCKHSNVSS